MVAISQNKQKKKRNKKKQTKERYKLFYRQAFKNFIMSYDQKIWPNICIKPCGWAFQTLAELLEQLADLLKPLYGKARPSVSQAQFSLWKAWPIVGKVSQCA